MTHGAGERRPLPDDDALAARLRAAGEQARQLRAPATLQARLDRAYAEYHAAQRATRQAARAPWRRPGWLAAGAVASCLVATVLWQVQQGDGPRNDSLARTSPAPLAAPPLHSSTHRPPAEGKARQWHATAAPERADTSAATTSASIAMSTAPSATTASARAPGIGPDRGSAASAAASAGTNTRMPSLPRLPRAALPALSLDASTLRIATTAPVLPSLTMQMPDGTRPAMPAMPAAEATEGGGDGDAPAVRSTEPSQAVHADAAHGVA